MKKERYGFEDICETEQGIFSDGNAGIVKESAMTHLQKADPVPAPEGVCWDVMCENCGPRRIVAEWQEIVALRQGISPHEAFPGHRTVWGWDQERQSWFPDIRCSGCQWQFRMMVTPREIDGALQYGIRRGWINPRALQETMQHCMAIKQQRGMR